MDTLSAQTEAHLASPDGALGNDIAVRPAQKADVPLLFRMLKQLAHAQLNGSEPEDEAQAAANRFRTSEKKLRQDGFSKSPLFSALIAEKNGAAVGMAMFHETYSTWSGTRGLFISDMFVEEDQRGTGVGYALVRHVARAAAARGLQRLELNVIHANPARNFYDRMGFAHYDNLLNYRLSDAGFARLAREKETP